MGNNGSIITHYRPPQFGDGPGTLSPTGVLQLSSCVGLLLCYVGGNPTVTTWMPTAAELLWTQLVLTALPPVQQVPRH